MNMDGGGLSALLAVTAENLIFTGGIGFLAA